MEWAHHPVQSMATEVIPAGKTTALEFTKNLRQLTSDLH
jgi:hypothetical protein